MHRWDNNRVVSSCKLGKGSFFRSAVKRNFGKKANEIFLCRGSLNFKKLTVSVKSLSRRPCSDWPFEKLQTHHFKA